MDNSGYFCLKAINLQGLVEAARAAETDSLQCGVDYIAPEIAMEKNPDVLAQDARDAAHRFSASKATSWLKFFDA